MGLDPNTGKILWVFDLFAANPDTLQKVPEKYATPLELAKAYRADAMRPPFPGYCPLAWQDYVLDAACIGHNAVTSALWCLKITNGQASRVWQDNACVPESASLKSCMAVLDGRLYVSDSYSPAFLPRKPGEPDKSRPYRGATIGEFQCRDIATGKLLWHTDAFNPEKPGPRRADSASVFMFLAGDRLIVCNSHGLWIAQLRNDGVQLLAHVPQAGAKLRRMLSEPILVDDRLFVRQLDADAKAGLLPVMGGNGNLMCLDLRQK
jgi:outer membrane protein assembly factor BamB